MLTLQKAKGAGAISLQISEQPIENLLNKEWLLTNGRGGYASSTIVGCNTRRYHGLLIGSLKPPINRIMALANCLETVIIGGTGFNLSTFEFSDKFAPAGFGYIKRFRQDTGVHFDYELDPPKAGLIQCRASPCPPKAGLSKPASGGLELTKSVYLVRDADTVVVEYDFTSVQEPVEFILRPYVGLQDFHLLQKSYAPLCSRRVGDELLVRYDRGGSCELFLSCPAANFENDQQWWFNFVYRSDKERGQDFMEDLWTPGFFKRHIDSPTKVILWANLSVARPSWPCLHGLEARATHQHLPPAPVFQAPATPVARRGCGRQEDAGADIDAVREDLRKHQSSVTTAAKKNRDEKLKILCIAADQFIVKRQTNHNHKTTILAGYPWFADWGRDAFIALPGLLLSTGRFEEAKSVLTTFAGAADEGMIPNCFDDKDGSVHFNSVDASLWFINAAFQYLSATGDSKIFMQDLMPVIRWIIDSYHKGTRFGIHADCDGLITAGDSQTQLTWMDAKCGGMAFTPRYGKAVEVNAMLYNSLCWLAQFYARRDIENAKHYKSLADKVGDSFCKLFWNPRCFAFAEQNGGGGYLNDCILPDGSVDASLRPNQIFAVSLPFSPLSDEQQKSVVDVVERQLLTPYGLRTLNAGDSRYKGKYTGPQQQRDEAYHQGTVWPYLIGPFVESFLKVNGFSRKSKKKAAEFISPLLDHLTKDGCIGSVSEIFDGDAPHKPKGCFAQAWSVAELIRAYLLIYS
ncbi:MAG: glycogen debranching enzyme N-terminal domain-containing protein [Planctomycetota bacterium]|nr:glycogen debranching enzyme N-terminal domain-containing protein [Planctomycetota bacterium]